MCNESVLSVLWIVSLHNVNSGSVSRTLGLQLRVQASVGRQGEIQGSERRRTRGQHDRERQEDEHHGARLLGRGVLAIMRELARNHAESPCSYDATSGAWAYQMRRERRWWQPKLVVGSALYLHEHHHLVFRSWPPQIPARRCELQLDTRGGALAIKRSAQRFMPTLVSA